METNQNTKAPEGASNGPIMAVIVGAGHRSLLYASYALKHPERLKIVGIVDPDAIRRERTAAIHHILPDFRFESVEQLVSRPPIAAAAINGTMDSLHVQTSLPLLKAGYDILLEKPIGTSEEEIFQLLEAARQYKKTVMICHVLRYAPFYVEIRKRLEAGEIGEIVNIQTVENVSYHHMAMGFVRGKWSNKDQSHSSMLMAKCCHDLDLLTWMKGGVSPRKVSSFGGIMQFKPEKAPDGAGTRCLVDCRIEADCPYSAGKNYITQGLWGDYVWHGIEHLGPTPTLEQKLESLRTDNPYGRCVWHCDNNVVDNQSLIVQFADGSTGTHNMVGATSKPCRSIHIVGTKGEIQGVMEDGYFVIRHPDADSGKEHVEERVEIHVSKEMHGGGDLRLVDDFLSVIGGKAPSISSTSLEDSIYGHLIGFAADRSREEERSIEIRALG